jgi:ABC transporter substrate binding protein
VPDNAAERQPPPGFILAANRKIPVQLGENLIIESYFAEAHHERYGDLARQIVTRKPDVIVTGTNPVVIAFKPATNTIPVVAFMLDPLKAGLVTSLAPTRRQSHRHNPRSRGRQPRRSDSRGYHRFWRAARNRHAEDRRRLACAEFCSRRNARCRSYCNSPAIKCDWRQNISEVTTPTAVVPRPLRR